MNEKQIADYRIKHTVKDHGFCLEVASLKSAIILSFPYRITSFEDTLYFEGKPLIKFINS